MADFPILQGNGITIPWSVAEQAFLGYVKKYGQGQSLDTIAQRGGFGVEEMDEFHPEWREHIRLRKQIADLVAALKACMAEIQDVLDENPNSIHLGLLVDQAEQALGKEE